MAEMAITRLPGEGLGDCALTFVERRAIDAGLAARQHAGYRAALRELGVQVEALEPLIGMPDGVFV